MIDLEDDPNRKEVIKHLVKGDREFVIFLIDEDLNVEATASNIDAYNIIKIAMLTSEPSKN